MDKAGKFLEIEALCENLMKSQSSSGLLRLKILYFASVYKNLSVSMIISKLGIKKSNFALMTTQLEQEGLIESKSTEIDRRCRTICLTEKGKDELDRYLKAIEKILPPSGPELERSVTLFLEYLNRFI